MWQIVHKRGGIFITFIHDIMPERLSVDEQGIYQYDTSISIYTLFLREDDPILIAWKKWLNFVIEDYMFFSGVFPNKIKFWELQDQDYVKTHYLF